MSQSKYWCFTINNPTEEDVTQCGLVDCSYIIYGDEVGEGGTPHLQGYIEFPTRRRRNAVARLLPRAFLASRRGSAEQAAEYCRKEGKFTERGEISQSEQGKRTDLDEVADMIKGGSSLQEIAQEYPKAFMRYGSGIKRTWDMLHVKESIPFYGPWWWRCDAEIQSLILWGPSNIGKTQWAKFLLPRALIVRHMDDLTGYDPAKYHGIIFDDMDFLHYPRTAQIHLVDWEEESSIHVRYTVATIPARTPKIFTSNTANIFLNDPAINRRLTWFECREPGLGAVDVAREPPLPPH